MQKLVTMSPTTTGLGALLLARLSQAPTRKRSQAAAAPMPKPSRPLADAPDAGPVGLDPRSFENPAHRGLIGPQDIFAAHIRETNARKDRTLALITASRTPEAAAAFGRSLLTDR